MDNRIVFLSELGYMVSNFVLSEFNE